MKLVFALASLLFVKSGTFDVRSDVKVRIPAGARQVRLWIPLPQDDPAQSVQNLQIQSPYTYRTVTDSEGNKLLFIEAENPSRPEWNVIETFRLTRRETGADPVASATRSLTGQETANMRHYLEANKYVVIDDTIRKLANEIVGNEKNPVAAMSKINEWMIEHIDYYAKDPEHKSGTDEASTLFCLKNQTGNCGDMAALFTALARSMGIPTRIIYGSFFKPSLNAQDVDSDAHTWMEFYAPKLGWIPLDPALADLYSGDYPVTPANRKLLALATADGTFGNFPEKRKYYFGHLEERRMTWSRGRDLTLSPKQKSGPVNHLFEAYLEVDGDVIPEGIGWDRKWTYREVH